MTRSLAAATLLCVALAVTPSHAAAVKVCGPGGTVEDVGNGWLMSHPTFPAGPATVTQVASPAFDPNLIYASNGVSLMRSKDAGCGWQSVFTADTNALTGAQSITALAVPTSANNSSYVYLGLTRSLAGVDQPSIVVSDSHGDGWNTTTSGLPDLGRVREIAVSPQVQLVAFAVVDVVVKDVVTRSSLYSTSNGGETWTARTATGDTFAPSGLIVDPVRQAALYAIDGSRPVRSLDNAVSFQPTPGDPGIGINELAAAPGAGSVRLAGTRADGNGVSRSADGGKTWELLRTPVPPRNVAMAPLQDIVAVSSGAEVWLLANGRAQPVTPLDGGAPMQLAVTAPTAAGYAVTGVSSGAVFRASFTLGTTTPIPLNGLKPILLLPARPFTQFPSLLTPDRLTVKLAAGESKVVPYRLLLPRTPTPVDVMFLLDSTGSYQDVIDGLKQMLAQIVNALNAAGLDVRFGIGNFEDYPPPYGIATSNNVPYELQRRIGPSDDSFAEAIERIDAHDGTGDGGQSSLTAMYQSLTGAGEVIRGNKVIAKGLDARFRPDALKLLMTSTDTAPHYKGQKLHGPNGTTIVHPGPSYGDVIQALRTRGVRSVGIPKFYEGGDTAVEPLRRLAEASGALAPLGGVDCDGNGTVDLDTADPLVCILNAGSTNPAESTMSAGLAAAVIGIVAGIADRKPVALRVTKGADRARIVSQAVRTVDLKADNELDYDVRLTCPRAAAKQYEIALQSATPIRSLAGGAITLACGGLPGTQPEYFDHDAVLPPRAATANVVTDLNVNVNTNTNTNPNPNPNPEPHPMLNVNVGMAVQQQRQLQLALAGESWHPGEEFAMSGLPRQPRPEPAFGAATAAMAAAATGVALRRRRRTALVYARR